jgi:hypothetical protein
MAIGGFLSLFLLWISFSIHLPVSVLLADVCDAVDTNVNGSLSSIIPCLDDSDLSPLTDLSTNGMQTALDQINNITLACCNVSFTLNNISAIEVRLYVIPFNNNIVLQLS